jgi:hypothetical protein
MWINHITSVVVTLKQPVSVILERFFNT